ncbi:unnamed protein product [Prorocentrum cordatum]|uniref:dCMP deaminase n=1 Tax=Prorocentrum cordatum TaxID=2364126 RepID=A0ABN9TBC9_9DINO|nr:unnamed protein product [Polarella glacialis]
MASRAREYVALFSAGVAGTAVGGALAAAWLARRQRRAAGGGAFLAEQSRGYNGFPRGISDDDLPWAKLSRTGDPLETKYPFVCHAEANAILNANTDKMAGQRLYVTMFPCNECAKMIVQAGLVEVVYCEAKDGGKQADMACYEASRRLLRLAGVRTRQHQLVRRIVVGNGKSATVAEAA